MAHNAKLFIGILVLAAVAAGFAVAFGVREVDLHGARLAAFPPADSPMPVLAAIDIDDTAPPAPGAPTVPPLPLRTGSEAVPAPAAPASASAPAPVPAAPALSLTADQGTSRAGACVFGGMAGAGAAVIVGPAEVAALVAGAALLPVSGPLIVAILGGSFATGCAVTALLAPAFR